MIDPDIREAMERRARGVDRLVAQDEAMRSAERRPAVAAASPVITLASMYRQAAGNAYAAGNDADAAKFREAAAKLDAVAADLPALPIATR